MKPARLAPTQPTVSDVQSTVNKIKEVAALIKQYDVSNDWSTLRSVETNLNNAFVAAAMLKGSINKNTDTIEKAGKFVEEFYNMIQEEQDSVDGMTAIIGALESAIEQLDSNRDGNLTLDDFQTA